MLMPFAPGTLHLYIYLKGHVAKRKEDPSIQKYVFRNLIIAQTGYSLSVQQRQWL